MSLEPNILHNQQIPSGPFSQILSQSISVGFPVQLVLVKPPPCTTEWLSAISSSVNKMHTPTCVGDLYHAALHARTHYMHAALGDTFPNFISRIYLTYWQLLGGDA